MGIGTITLIWLVVKTIKGVFWLLGKGLESCFREKYPYDFEINLSNGKPTHIYTLLSHPHRSKCHNLLLSILKTANNGNLPNHFDGYWCNYSYMASR